MKLNMITLAIIAVFAVLFFHQASGMPWTPSHIVGVAIAAPAVLLLILARLQLGRAFSVRAKASTLVTSGLYSRIRNPIYVFGSLFFVGIIIWTNRPWLLVGFVVLIPMQVYRSRKEAEVLETKFGDEYREYKQKTWF
ncbi:isoprenylcysteine carboxylmethyltransferase family protein [Telmatobacter sp. DSM 110680]|uniref:Isoprenylcysteine carboxylmethyltransferase family protein n=1 Tax=Telmatobacter sp. DSM 110680 TaxID=3036704 RepID=A0AAU7DM62_9BACT